MDDDTGHRGSFVERARSVISSVQEDENVKQASAAAKEAASRAQEASKSFSRKITQEDSWEELRGDVEELTEIVRAHHALIVDLIARVEALEQAAGSGHGG
jgi:hypothetical protein